MTDTKLIETLASAWFKGTSEKEEAIESFFNNIIPEDVFGMTWNDAKEFIRGFIYKSVVNKTLAQVLYNFLNENLKC